jgi:hypothetical protein
VRYKLNSGELAWLGLILYIVTYDLVALRKGIHTLSKAFHIITLNKIGQTILLIVWSYLTVHLFYWLPAKYDPLRRWRN